MTEIIYIPDLGDIDSATVVEVLVKPGDKIDLEQSIVVLEGDKATMEIPATCAGVVESVNVKVGDKVSAKDICCNVLSESKTVADPVETTVAVAPKESSILQTMLVPDLGDASQATVVEVLVGPGDSVELEQPVMVLEGDKATMEIPASFAGIIESVSVKVKDQVSTGDAILEIKTIVQTEETVVAQEPVQAEVKRQSLENMLVPDLGDASQATVVEVLVGPGDSVELEQPVMVLEGDKATMEIPASFAGIIESVSVKVKDQVSTGDAILKIKVSEIVEPEVVEVVEVAATQAVNKVEEFVPSGSVYAGPSIRRLARRLGVDLTKVKPTGRKGRIIRSDVESYVKAALAGGGQVVQDSLNLLPWPKLNPEEFGEVEVEDLIKAKQMSGAFLHRNWVKIPHVTQFDQADITDLENWRKAHKQEALDLGCKISPLILVIKALVESLKAYPEFNASLSKDGKQLIKKKYYNIGVAVDSPNGLLVPVIKDVDKKTIVELAKEIAAVAKIAREKGLSPDMMKGGSFTVSSLGGIGGTAFTPIVNAPDVAILGLSRSSIQPIYQNDTWVPRLMLPLSLSYDHRAIDGAQGARFIVDLTERLGNINEIIKKYW